MNHRALVVGAIGSAPVTRVARSLVGGLRILAYHTIRDVSAFAAQVRHISHNYHPVGATEISDAYRVGEPLPPRSVWVTFDDGDPSVVERALPLLEKLQIPSTMFICPGLIDTQEPFWWDVLRCAQIAGVSVFLHERDWGKEPSSLADLKQCPDEVRRSVVAQLKTRTENVIGYRITHEQMTLQQMRRWQDAGNTFGNHSWDHPCLDRCSEQAQRDQVRRAHEWLEGNLPQEVKLFAYPNGNWTTTAEQELYALGYDLAVGFDHRVATLRQNHLRLSRLRVDATNSLDRFRSIVSGAHPALFGVVARTLSLHRDDRRRLPKGEA